MSAEVSALDLVSGEVRALAPLPYGQFGGAAVQGDAGVIVVGGANDDGPLDRVYVIHDGDSAFEDAGALPIPMAVPALAEVEGELLVCGHDSSRARCWRGDGHEWRVIGEIANGWPRQVVVEARAGSALVLGSGSPGDTLARLDLRTGVVEPIALELGIGARLFAAGDRTMLVPGRPDFIDPDAPASTTIWWLGSESASPERSGLEVPRYLAGPSSAFAEGRLWIVGGGAAEAMVISSNGRSSVAIPKDLRGGLLVLGDGDRKPAIVGAHAWARAPGPYPYARVFRLPRLADWSASR